MNRKVLYFAFALLITVLCGCGNAAGSVPNDSGANISEPDGMPQTGAESAEKLTDEQALSAVINYCCAMNPDLEDIAEEGEYPVYWNVSSSGEYEIVVLFRSYTGAQNRYYIDRNTGDTYVTEFVPGITEEEQRSGESFNIRDFLPGN